MNILLVPSGSVNPVDSLVDTPTLKRLEKALELWENGDYDYIILSGGQTQASGIETKPEAETMHDWLLKQPTQPSKERLIIESKARDTYENAILSLEILKTDLRFKNLPTRLFVVTNQLHGLRFLTTFQQGLRWYSLSLIDSGETLTLRKKVFEYFLITMHSLDPLGRNPLSRWNRKRRSYPRP